MKGKDMSRQTGMKGKPTAAAQSSTPRNVYQSPELYDLRRSPEGDPRVLQSSSLFLGETSKTWAPSTASTATGMTSSHTYYGHGGYYDTTQSIHSHPAYVDEYYDTNVPLEFGPQHNMYAAPYYQVGSSCTHHHHHHHHNCNGHGEGHMQYQAACGESIRHKQSKSKPVSHHQPQVPKPDRHQQPQSIATKPQVPKPDRHQLQQQPQSIAIKPGKAYYRRHPKNQNLQNHVPDGANLFIFHIPNNFRNKNLLELFKPYGNVEAVNIAVGHDRRGKGYGFVSYDDAASASKAIEHLNGYQVSMI